MTNIQPATQKAYEFGDDTQVWINALSHVPQVARQAYSIVLSSGSPERIAEALVDTDHKNITLMKHTEKFSYENRNCYNLVMMNPPFFTESGHPLFNPFLERSYDLMNDESYGVFILPSSAVTTGHRDSKILSKLFDIEVINLYINNAGFDEVHRSCVSVVCRKRTKKNSNDSARLYIDDVYVTKVDPHNFITLKNKFYDGPQGRFAKQNLALILMLINKVHNTANDELLLPKNTNESFSIIYRHPARGTNYDKINKKSYERGPGLSIGIQKSRPSKTLVKCRDEDQLIWYTRCSNLFLLLNDALASHQNGKTVPLMRCISKDYHTLRTNQDIYNYYNFTNEEIAFLETHAALKIQDFKSNNKWASHLD